MAGNGLQRGPQNPPVIKMTRRPVSDGERELFLKTLAASGNLSEACRVSHPSTKNPALATFRGLRERDPEFARKWDDALAQFDGRILAEMTRRAIEGTEKGVYQAGRRVYDVDPVTGEPVAASVREFSDRLLELLWKSRRNSESLKSAGFTIAESNLNVVHSGGVVHSTPSLALHREDLVCLTAQQRVALSGILISIAKARGAESNAAVDITPEPQALEYHPSTFSIAGSKKSRRSTISAWVSWRCLSSFPYRPNVICWCV